MSRLKFMSIIEIDLYFIVILSIDFSDILKVI